MADFIVFLRWFLSAPGRIGSVIPSSRFLAERMMREVDWEKVRSIAELGPGTGVFTKTILQKKRADATFFLVERDPQFREMLHARFPEIAIFDEASSLTAHLRQMNLTQVDLVISGLPFAVFPEELRSAILDEVVKVLAPGGMFVTFQYSLQLYEELKCRFPSVKLGFTLFNIPPAFIYSCHK